MSDLEAKVTEQDQDKEKTDERIERLQAINTSMQQMYEQSTEKLKQEHEN